MHLFIAILYIVAAILCASVAITGSPIWWFSAGLFLAAAVISINTHTIVRRRRR
jgi:ABC-type multidrug transport system permease subunit